jgi:HNH endonuclease
VSSITQAQLQQIFDLNPETGELIWKRPTVPQVKVGTVAGRRQSNGRVLIRIRGEDYPRPRAHLVYQYVYGGPLPSEVLHINGKIADDRPENLRRIIRYPGEELPQAYLHKTFELDCDTGELFRRVETQNRVTRETKPAGSLGDSGRWEISVLGQKVRRHKLVFLYAYGHMPEQINYKNGILTDDRPENLREVTTSQRRMSGVGKLGRDLPKGVCQQSAKCRRPFYARIQIDGKSLYLGSFETPEEAAAAYDAAAENLFGEFARPNSLA